MAQSISCSWFLSSGVINLENAPNGLRFHMRDTRLVVKQTLQPKHPIHRYPGLRHPFGGVLNKPAVHYRDYPKGKRTAEKSAGRRFLQVKVLKLGADHSGQLTRDAKPNLCASVLAIKEKQDRHHVNSPLFC